MHLASNASYRLHQRLSVGFHHHRLEAFARGPYYSQRAAPRMPVQADVAIHGCPPLGRTLEKAVANTGLHERIWRVPAAPPRGRASLMPGRQAGHLGGSTPASGSRTVAAKTSTPSPRALAPSTGRRSLHHQTL